MNKQHQLITKSLGFVIHPFIPVTGSNLRIADFATGTGIWLTEASKIVDPSCVLEGFDISSAQFPDASQLPCNISFKVHDILKPAAEQYREKYDIIAVRFISSVLARDDWEKAVANLVLLLSEWTPDPSTY